MNTLSKTLENKGYTRKDLIPTALPLPVWELDVEVEQESKVSAAERAVLQLVKLGRDDRVELTQRLGLGRDTRLVEHVLVRALKLAAIDAVGERLVVTELGDRWIAERQLRERRALTLVVRYDILHDTFEWHDDERPAPSNVWTIVCDNPSDAVVHAARPRIAALVRAGLPFEPERRERERKTYELCSMVVRARRVHHREVEVAVWQHPTDAECPARLVGHIGGAEQRALTELLAPMKRVSRREQFVNGGS